MSFVASLKKEKNRKTFPDFNSFYSNQTNSTNNESQRISNLKKVYFNWVEIIDVESYKRFYQIGILKLESSENDSSNICKNCNCAIY